MNRRGFLGTILAAAVAPAVILRADALMRIVPREMTFLTGEVGRYDGVLIHHSERWQLDQLCRARAARVDALMADAFKDYLLLGHPMDPINIAKDFHV